MFWETKEKCMNKRIAIPTPSDSKLTKSYAKPEMMIIEFDTETRLLVESDNEIPGSDDEYNGVFG